MMYFSVIKMIHGQGPGELPVVIPTFNNPSYLQNMINQLEKYNLTNIIILDNWSTNPDMNSLLSKLCDKYTVVKKFTNDGPREYYLNKKLFNWLPEKFILTDPDIGFNENLPANFVQSLIDISLKHNLYKVGFALDIEMNGIDSNIKEIMFGNLMSMYQWETQFYNHQIDSVDNQPVYLAAIDTTFCLVNKKFYEPYDEPMQIRDKCARVGGTFIAQHYGWHKNPPMTEEEFDFYLSMVPPQWSFTSNAIKMKRGL